MSSRKSKSKSVPRQSSEGRERFGSCPQLKRLQERSADKKKSPEKFKTVAKIPASREDSSSNWKALLQKQGKKLPSTTHTSRSPGRDNQKKRMESDSTTEIKRVRQSLESDTGSSTGRSRSTSEARCSSQQSMVSDTTSSSTPDNTSVLSEIGASGGNSEVDPSCRVKQEFRALGLAESNKGQTRPSRPTAKHPPGKIVMHPSQIPPALGSNGKRLLSCLPAGLNEFGFFDYGHYGALRTKVTAAHEEFMQDTVVVAMDCEMVGVGPMKESALARVSIVNMYGYCLYDRFVKPGLPVADYRTQFSGIREPDLRNAPPFQVVAKEVSDILRGHILVGHSLKSDLNVLYLNHAKARMRDTAFYFKKIMHAKTPKLKTVVKRVFGIEIQQGEHSSITDAQATMALYLVYQKEWETSVRQSNRGLDVFKLCNDDFNSIMLARKMGTTPPLPLPQLLPGNSGGSMQSQQTLNWYEQRQETTPTSPFPAENLLYSSYSSYPISSNPIDLGGGSPQNFPALPPANVVMNVHNGADHYLQPVMYRDMEQQFPPLVHEYPVPVPGFAAHHAMMPFHQPFDPIFPLYHQPQFFQPIYFPPAPINVHHIHQHPVMMPPQQYFEPAIPVPILPPHMQGQWVDFAHL